MREPFHKGIRLALEVDAHDDCGGGGDGDDGADCGVGRHTVPFFIDGEQMKIKKK
jgi:hypothetical protein